MLLIGYLFPCRSSSFFRATFIRADEPDALSREAFSLSALRHRATVVKGPRNSTITAKHYGVSSRKRHPELECFSGSTSEQSLHTSIGVNSASETLVFRQFAVLHPGGAAMRWHSENAPHTARRLFESQLPDVGRTLPMSRHTS